jgi:hypothetical protein
VSTRLGRRTAHFNKRVTTRLTRSLARQLPGFGVVVHRGRASARKLETPVNVFNATAATRSRSRCGSDSDFLDLTESPNHD